MRLKHRVSYWFTTFASLAIAGCEANVYEIEMRPKGDSIQRELSCWRERTQNNTSEVVEFPAEELARIAAAYDDAAPSTDAGKHKFAGAFTGTMPNDVGGSGSYTFWKTPMGSVSAYVERVRGNDDPLADVEKRQQAADRIADLLIGWLASELEGKPGFAELREFLDNRFRRDLRNLTLYGWAYGMVSEDEDAIVPNFLARIGQYLVDRSYFTPDQLPMLTRSVQERGDVGPARLLDFLQALAASKMGIAADQPIPESLQFLSNLSVVEASSNKYLEKTDEFVRLLEEWDRNQATNPDAIRPEPGAVIDDLVMQAFLPTFYIGPSDRIKVKVAVPTEPFATNGQWDENAQQIQWSRPILASVSNSDSDPAGIPALLYAFWSSPDAKAQKARFGRIVLQGESLGGYCLWYRGLSKQEVKEWDQFVSRLKPSDDLADRLRSFRFSHEPPASEDGEEVNDLAATPRELILLGLTDEAPAN